MIIPDTNLLLYTTDRESLSHLKSQHWWNSTLQESKPVGLCAPAAFGYLRIVTNPRICRGAVTVQEAFAFVENWLSYPSVQWLEPDHVHLSRVKSLLMDLGTAGNLVPDAQIAAYAQQYNGVIYTADSDFKKFHGVRWKNPLI